MSSTSARCFGGTKLLWTHEAYVQNAVLGLFRTMLRRFSGLLNFFTQWPPWGRGNCLRSFLQLASSGFKRLKTSPWEPMGAWSPPQVHCFRALRPLSRAVNGNRFQPTVRSASSSWLGGLWQTTRMFGDGFLDKPWIVGGKWSQTSGRHMIKGHHGKLPSTASHAWQVYWRSIWSANAQHQFRGEDWSAWKWNFTRQAQLNFGLENENNLPPKDLSTAKLDTHSAGDLDQNFSLPRI